jgi:hypothetical protein
LRWEISVLHREIREIHREIGEIRRSGEGFAVHSELG